MRASQEPLMFTESKPAETSTSQTRPFAGASHKARKNAGTADHAQERDLDNFSWLHVWRSPSGMSPAVSDERQRLPLSLLPFFLLVSLIYTTSNYHFPQRSQPPTANHYYKRVPHRHSPTVPPRLSSCLPTWASFVTRLVCGWSRVDSSKDDHRSKRGRNIHDLFFVFRCTCSVPFTTQTLHGKHFQGVRDDTGTKDRLQRRIWTTLCGSSDRSYILW
jgi:hypothetical protein